MTCFSNEANSLVTDCKELLQTLPHQHSYDYPPELLSLQGKKRIFQLHFDPESTKERQLFILDTCWDDTPLLPPPNAVHAESTIDSSRTTAPMKIQMKANITTSQTKDPELLDLKHSEITPPSEQPKPITVPEERKPAEAVELKEIQVKTPGKEATRPAIPMDTPPETLKEQFSLSQTSDSVKQTVRKSARKALFTGTNDESTTSGFKKSKKEG